MISALGSVGIGLVWGWLMGMHSDHVRRRILTGLLLGGATLVLALVIIWVIDWRSVLAFLVSVGLALLLHVAWRRDLSRRFGAPKI